MEALRDGADIVIMLHPDGQYDPAILPEMIRPIQEGRADMVLGSRMMLPGGAARGGMPLWKRIANRFLTTAENLAMGRQFSECHTGYRAYSRRFLETVPFLRNANGFVFDTEVIFQAVHFGLPRGGGADLDPLLRRRVVGRLPRRRRLRPGHAGHRRPVPAPPVGSDLVREVPVLTLPGTWSGRARRSRRLRVDRGPRRRPRVRRPGACGRGSGRRGC